MIDWVVECMRPSQPHRFVFLCLGEHLRETPMRAVLERSAPGCLVVGVESVTEGAACTVLLAREWIDGDAPLMIANSDQWVDIAVDDYLAAMACAPPMSNTRDTPDRAAAARSASVGRGVARTTSGTPATAAGIADISTLDG